jgi:hypothetical protein
LAKDTLEKMLDKNGVLRPSTASLEAAAAADIKVPSGQIGSAREWYHWIGL